MSCRKIASALKKKGYNIKSIEYSGGDWGGGYLLELEEDNETKALEHKPNCEIESQFDDLEEAMNWIEQLPSLV